MISSAGYLLAVAALALVFFAWGIRALQLFRLESRNSLESLLFAAGFSVGVLEIVLFALTMRGRLTFVSGIVLLGLLALTAGRGWIKMAEHFRSLRRNLVDSLRDPSNRFLAACMLLVLVVGAFVSMAPLTGSDAMNYHFTVPLLWRGHAAGPIFWQVLSFFTGQGHLLISLGLALGSDHISLGLVFLGGAFSGAATFAVARQLMSATWAWLCALVYLAAPLVFWQMTTSGSPDVWTVFFVTLAALAVGRASRADAPLGDRWLILAGFFSGCAAGVKYTAWIIPVVLLLHILAMRKSFKVLFFSGLASLVAGVWPLVRNFAWTGDPVFPFLTPILHPERVNSANMTFILSATGASHAARSLPGLLAFPFVMILRGADNGFGQYFGPLVLLFVPLLFFIPWRNALVRISLIFWLALFASNIFSSQMGRFLLPAFGLALALTFSGVAVAAVKGFRVVTMASVASIFLFLGFSAASDMLYARSFLPVALGRESRSAFLGRMAPDYQVAEFVNQQIGADPSGGKVMVFFRHLYYLRVPYIDGSTDYSWEMDPKKIANGGELLRYLTEKRVEWVVKSSEYPPDMEGAFDQLEAAGELVPVAKAEVESLGGTGRMFGFRDTEPVVLLKVVPDDNKK